MEKMNDCLYFVHLYFFTEMFLEFNGILAIVSVSRVLNYFFLLLVCFHICFSLIIKFRNIFLNRRISMSLNE